MSLQQVYENGVRFHHYANTAYPLTPRSFRSYRLTGDQRIRAFLEEQWAKADELSLYVHVPFCKVRCKFCEYVVVDGEDRAHEDEYVDLLLREIAMYGPLLRGKRVVGFDVGGGTPTKLSVANLARITDAINGTFELAEELVPSIETTPVIAAREPEKLEALLEMGYRRISMGVQTVSEKLLNELGREGAARIYEQATKRIREAGFQRFNIDLMYGFLNQTDEDFEHTVRYATSLGPEYITLYRNRYKGTRLEQEAPGVSLYRIMRQYRIAFDTLNKCGYEANPGKNTFSRVTGDYGTSDYLTRRVIEGVPYLGLGLGAQSFGVDYLAYNQGAAGKKLKQYRKQIGRGRFPIQDIYDLPQDECMAKMLSVAFYFGFIDLPAFQKRFGRALEEQYGGEVAFVLEHGLMERRDDRLMLTERGSDYINGVIPLFFSARSKQELAELIAAWPKEDGGEQEFLKAYHIENFARPSVAVDLVVVATDDEAQGKPKAEGLSVVLIRRGDHPYMNAWALPGGFVRPGESVEQAAQRELREEAGVSQVPLTQLRVFSAPGRDPRGWIMSCAFLAVVDRASLSLRFGDDALDARLFTIDWDQDEGEERGYTLTLRSGDDETVLTARLRRSEDGFEVVENTGIAFDHAAILAHALDAMHPAA